MTWRHGNPKPKAFHQLTLFCDMRSAVWNHSSCQTQAKGAFDPFKHHKTKQLWHIHSVCIWFVNASPSGIAFTNQIQSLWIWYNYYLGSYFSYLLCSRFAWRFNIQFVHSLASYIASYLTVTSYTVYTATACIHHGELCYS